MAKPQPLRRYRVKGTATVKKAVVTVEDVFTGCDIMMAISRAATMLRIQHDDLALSFSSVTATEITGVGQ